jgi:Fic family protein
MEELVSWTREQLFAKELHPLLTIGIFVVVFLAIHPFQDGNGRLSRLLTTLLLLQTGYAYVPYSSLESVIERNKESYYLALRRTQGALKSDNPDFTPWLIFFLRGLQKQKVQISAVQFCEFRTANAVSTFCLTLFCCRFTSNRGSVTGSTRRHANVLCASSNL